MSSAGQYFQTLNAFDVLGNLIPGLIVVCGLLGFIHTDIPSFGATEVGGTVVASFVVGSFVQQHASAVAGNRETFELTIKSTEYPANSLDSEPDSQESAENEGSTRFGRLANLPLIGPISDPVVGWAGSPDGEELDDAVLTGRIRQHLLDTHSIPTNFDDFQVLYHLMLSRVDGASTARRATRIQARRNFYRGLWIAAWWFGVFVFAATVLIPLFDQCLSVISWRGSVLWQYSRPNFHSVWSPAWQLLIPTVIVIYLAKHGYESQEEDFIEYLFTDYATTLEDTDSTDPIPDSFEHSHELTIQTDGEQTTGQRENDDDN